MSIKVITPTFSSTQHNPYKITAQNVHKVSCAMGNDYARLAKLIGHEHALTLLYELHKKERSTLAAPSEFRIWDEDATYSYNRIKELAGEDVAKQVAAYTKEKNLTEFSFPHIAKVERELLEISILDDFKEILAMPPHEQYKKFHLSGCVSNKDVQVFYQFSIEAERFSTYGDRYDRSRIQDMTRDMAIRYAWARYQAGGYADEDVSFEKGNENSFIMFLYQRYRPNGYHLERLIESMKNEAEKKGA